MTHTEPLVDGAFRGDISRRKSRRTVSGVGKDNQLEKVFGGNLSYNEISKVNEVCLMICEHFPKPSNIQCPICSPEAVYEIERQIWNTEPIVELLQNGEPWSSPWDSNFRFGRVKAAIILYSIDFIQDFALSSAPGTMIPEPIIYEADPGLIIQLQTIPNFTKPNGEFVDIPFLRLDRVKDGLLTSHIGFGQLKAAALVILKDDLDNWLRSVHGWYR